MGNNKKHQYISLVILSFAVTSCFRSNKNVEVVRAQLSYTAKIQEENVNLSFRKVVKGSFLSFLIAKDIFTDFTDTSAYRRTIIITIPIVDSAFSLTKKDSLRAFKLIRTDCRGLCADSKIEPVDEGEIWGKRIKGLKWKIFIKHKDFLLDTVLNFKINKVGVAQLKK